MSILKNQYIVTMEDNSKWAVPVEVIARHRASYYADKEFDGDVEKSLTEDTIPLFEGDDYEIADWAKNNMNWNGTVKDLAVCISPAEIDFQDGWMNGEYEIS